MVIYFYLFNWIKHLIVYTLKLTYHFIQKENSPYPNVIGSRQIYNNKINTTNKICFIPFAWVSLRKIHCQNHHVSSYVLMEKFDFGLVEVRSSPFRIVNSLKQALSLLNALFGSTQSYNIYTWELVASDTIIALLLHFTSQTDNLVSSSYVRNRQGT